MTDTLFPSRYDRLEIQSFKRPTDIKTLKKTHVSFSGSLQRHPYDAKKIIVIADPFSSNTVYYEFKTKDISYLEELPNVVDINGKAISMVRIWVKKLSIGIRSAPFLVEDI